MASGGPSKRRLDVAREVLSMLRNEPRFRDSVRRQASGERRVVVVSPNERMKSFFERVGDAGFPVTVCLRAPNKGLHIIHLDKRSDGPHEHTEDEVLLVHPNITIKMMVEALWREGGSAILHRAEPETHRHMDYLASAGV